MNTAHHCKHHEIWHVVNFPFVKIDAVLCKKQKQTKKRRTLSTVENLIGSNEMKSLRIRASISQYIHGALS